MWSPAIHAILRTTSGKTHKFKTKSFVSETQTFTLSCPLKNTYTVMAEEKKDSGNNNTNLSEAEPTIF